MIERSITLLAVVILASGCMESQFTLEPTSRLPNWLSPPTGVKRGDVTVRLRYYVRAIPGDDVEIALLSANGRVLSEATGSLCWHPIMRPKRNQYGGFDPYSYPHYVYIRANGRLEVIEHQRGPLFRVSDDVHLVKGALESKECDKG